jgi:hypothetical protein
MKWKEYGKDELLKILNRLRDYKTNYLLFVKKYNAPFTNNQEECSLRSCKGKCTLVNAVDLPPLCYFRHWGGELLLALPRFSTLSSACVYRKESRMDSFLYTAVRRSLANVETSAVSFAVSWFALLCSFMGLPPFSVGDFHHLHGSLRIL